MKKIILVVVGIIIVAALGRLGWAYYQVKNDEASTAKIPMVVTTTGPESATLISNTQIPVLVTANTTTAKPCALSKQEQVNETFVSGRVIFPKGIPKSDKYTATGDRNQFIDSDGNFCSVGVKGKPHLVMFMGPNETSFSLATIVLNSNTDVIGQIVDSKSTAVALVYIRIGQGNSNPKILDIISSNTDVLKFAVSINTLNNLTASDLDRGGRLFNDYTNAVTSVLKSLNTSVAKTITPVTKAQQLVISNIKTTSSSSTIAIMFDTNIPAYGSIQLEIPPTEVEKAICSDEMLVDIEVETTLNHSVTVSGLCPNMAFEVTGVAYLSLDPVAQEKLKVLSKKIKVQTTN